MCSVYLHDVLHNLLLRGDRGNDCSHESLINRHWKQLYLYVTTEIIKENIIEHEWRDKKTCLCRQNETIVNIMPFSKRNILKKSGTNRAWY